MEPAMKEYKGQGAFLVGAATECYLKVMKRMAEGLGMGTAYTVIERAGHLPMVEHPKRVPEVVSEMLQR